MSSAPSPVSASSSSSSSSVADFLSSRGVTLKSGSGSGGLGMIKLWVSKNRYVAIGGGAAILAVLLAVVYMLYKKHKKDQLGGL